MRKKSPKQLKAQAERIYFRLVGHRTKWDQIVASVTSAMLSGKLAFNPRKILKAEAAEVAAERRLEAELVQIVPLTPAEEAVIKTPSVPEPTYSNAPSGTYPHGDYYNTYCYRPPTDPNMDHPSD